MKHHADGKLADRSVRAEGLMHEARLYATHAGLFDTPEYIIFVQVSQQAMRGPLTDELLSQVEQAAEAVLNLQPPDGGTSA